VNDTHNVVNKSTRTILTSAMPSRTAKMTEQEFMDYVEGFKNPFPKEFIEQLKRRYKPASDDLIGFAEAVALWILHESARGLREDMVSYNGERFPVKREGQNELLKEDAEILLDIVGPYRTAISEKRWWDAVKLLNEAVRQIQHCLRLRENDVEDKLLSTGARTWAGMKKGTKSRWGDPERRLWRTQRYINEVCTRNRQIGKTKLVQKVAKMEGAFCESSIWKKLRYDQLVIPSK